MTILSCWHLVTNWIWWTFFNFHPCNTVLLPQNTCAVSSLRWGSLQTFIRGNSSPRLHLVIQCSYEIISLFMPFWQERSAFSGASFYWNTPGAFCRIFPDELIVISLGILHAASDRDFRSKIWHVHLYWRVEDHLVQRHGMLKQCATVVYSSLGIIYVQSCV